jgi:Na+/H+ antiporter NhaD/arsenite permease-like protein
MNWGIFLFVSFYLLISTRWIEKFKLDRASIAMIFIVISIFTKQITSQVAIDAVDQQIILLLLAMMGMGAFLLETKLLENLMLRLLEKIKTPKKLLLFLILLIGVSSALITNDAVCLILAPLMVKMISDYRLPAKPFLLALCTSANTGSAMTLVGNPQNMLCARLGNLSYFDYLNDTFLITVLALIVNYYMIVMIFRKEIEATDLNQDGLLDVTVAEKNQAQAFSLDHFKILAIFIVSMVIYLIGYDLAWTALLGFALMLLTVRIPSEKIWHQIDFSLLVFFGGLLIMLEVLILSGGAKIVFDHLPMISSQNSFWAYLQNTSIFMVASNLVSNVPFILMVEDELKGIENAKDIWTLLALTSTFAGNSTLFGSVANLIVAENAKSIGGLGFMDVLKVGLPLSIISSLIAIVILLY